MNIEAYGNLKLAKGIINRMTISDKVDYVNIVSDLVPPYILTTTDGKQPFSIETILCVTVGAILTSSRQEFEAICGFYRTGYRSILREALYNGRGEIPHSQWRREIRQLYHNIKDNIEQIPLPAAASY